MDLFHLQAEAHGSVFWHPNGYIIWRQLEAYMRRRLDAAGYARGQDPAADGRPPVGEDRATGANIARTCSSSRTRSRSRRRRCADPVGRRRSDGVEADELPGPCPDLQAGHHQLPRPAAPPRRVRLLPPQRAAWRAARHHARPPVHPGRRPHLLPRGPDRSTRCVAFCDLLDSVYRDLGFDNYAIKLALRPDKRFGTRRRCGTGPSSRCATPSPPPAATPRNSAGRNCPARAPSTRPSSNSI